MLRFLAAERLSAHPALARSMFRDRAAQFRDRLGWDVTVDAAGRERDAYDSQRPLYVIWQGADGRHGGSLRLLPTIGRTMVNDHFAGLAGGGLRDPQIWECSRFCLSQAAAPGVSAALMLGALEVGLTLGLSHAVGVFDRPMIRVYRRLGWPPALLSGPGRGAGPVAAGLWRFDAALRPVLGQGARLPPGQAARWLAADLGPAWQDDTAPPRIAAHA